MKPISSPLRKSLIVCLIAFGLGAIQCHDGKSSQPAQTQQKKAKEEAPAPQSAAELASFQVQRARYLAVPITPLASSTFRGMALPLYNEFPSLKYEQMLDRAAEMGTTHLSLVVTWRQRTIHDNRIEPAPPETPKDERVRAIIKYANSKGVKVLLFPIVHVERRSEGEWRGKLKPTDADAWKRDYESFLLHYANLAKESGAWGLSVGSELSSMEAETRFWMSLISKVRNGFDGKLIYSANWDHYQHPEFWGQLDYIGVSSYFEVAKSQTEALHTVSNRWEKHRTDLLKFAKEQNRPLVLTEVGYPAVASAAVKPWDYTTSSPASSIAQVAGFAALVGAWSEPSPDFAGLFVWHAWGFGGEGDTSYAVREKPSEELLKSWFRSQH